MNNGWILACPCAKCGYGLPYGKPSDWLPTEAGPPSGKKWLHCTQCGGTQFNQARPGREVFKFVWWNPFTWWDTVWEWNNDPAEIRPWAHRATPKLILLDGDKT